MKFLKNYNEDGVKLDIFKCDCGTHVGIDSNYQGELDCPQCKEEFVIENN